MAKNSGSTAAGFGIGMGSVLAMLISWEYTQSVLWTILHGIFGWIYVIVSLFNGKAQL